MGNVRKTLLSVTAGAAMLAACAGGGGDNNQPVTSLSQPLQFQDRELGAIDLIGMIDPEKRRALLAGRDCEMPASAPRNRDQQRVLYARDLDCAMAAFQTYHLGYDEFVGSRSLGNDALYQGAVNSVALAVRRNQIQDRIMMRSDMLCAEFSRTLGIELALDNDTLIGDLVRSSPGALVGTVGSLFIDDDAVWVLANATGVTRMAGIAPDEQQLEVRIAQIAFEGVALERKAVRRGIDARRYYQPGADPFDQPLIPADVSDRIAGDTAGIASIGAYTLEAALGDVIAYHDTCSLGAGLKYAHDRLGGLLDEAGAP